MRVTVGGVLLFGGAAAFVVLGPMKVLDPSLVSNQIDGLKKSADWVMGYFKSAEPESKPAEPVNPPPVAQPPAAQAQAPVQPPVVPAPAPVTPEVVEAPPVPAAAPAKKKKLRHHRVKKSPAPAKSVTSTPAPTAVQPAAVAKKSTGGADKLIGTYVSLKLKTGRDVKGILQGKTDKEYTVEIPGMGPFSYPVANVVSVGPAE